MKSMHAWWICRYFILLGICLKHKQVAVRALLKNYIWLLHVDSILVKAERTCLNPMMKDNAARFIQWYVCWGLTWPNNMMQYWCCLYFTGSMSSEEGEKIDVVVVALVLVYSKPLMKTKSWNWCWCWSRSCLQWTSRSDEEDKELISVLLSSSLFLFTVNLW